LCWKDRVTNTENDEDGFLFWGLGLIFWLLFIELRNWRALLYKSEWVHISEVYGSQKRAQIDPIPPNPTREMISPALNYSNEKATKIQVPDELILTKKREIWNQFGVECFKSVSTEKLNGEWRCTTYTHARNKLQEWYWLFKNTSSYSPISKFHV
jgi:hypothetical protein